MMRRLGTLVTSRWRKLAGTAPAAVVVLGLISCLCTLLAVIGPRDASRLRTDAFREFIAAAPATDKTVVGSISDNGASTGLPEGLSASQVLRAQDRLRHNLRGLPLAPSSADWSSLTTPSVGVTVSAHSPARQAVLPPKLEISYRNTLASNVRLVAGRLPAGRPAGGPANVMQAAVTVATARRFGLAVGSLLPLPGTGIELDVTAIVRPREPAALFWTADPVLAAPDIVYNGPYDLWLGGAFIDAGAVSTLQARFNMTATQVSWTFPVVLGRLTAGQASQLQQQLAGALSTAGNLTGTSAGLSVRMSSGTAPLIAEFEAEAASVGSVLDLLSVSLAVLAAAVVLLAGWLLAEQRRPEFAVLRARGAARRQLAVVILRASAVTVLPGALIGLAIGVALTPAAPAQLSWWLAGLEVFAALAGPALITARMHRGYAPVRPDQSPGRLASAQRLIVEIALALGAAGGLIVLREQGLSGGRDLYPSAAPALLAIGVAVIVLRAYPPLVRGLARLTGHRNGATAFLGLARAARVPASAVLPAFAMVLALALVSFAGMVRGAVARGEVAASWQQAGADAVVSTPGPVSSALQRSVAAVPGVRHVASADIAVGSVASVGQFGVLLVNPAQYATVLAASPLPQLPSAFAAPGGARSKDRPVPVLASPALAAKLGRGSANVLLDAQQLIRVRVVGQAPAMSAVAATSAGYLVLDRQAAARLGIVGLSRGPDALLLAGPSIGQPGLRAAVARDAPRASVLLRSRLLARLEAAPLRHGAYLALVLGAVASACCCLLVLLLSLLLSAGSRQQALARMNTMGLSAAQGRLLTLIEVLPQLLAVLAGGLACAVVLVPVLGPALSLSVFTGSAAPVSLSVQPAWLAGTAVALLALAITTLAGQTLVASRGAPRSLLIGG